MKKIKLDKISIEENNVTDPNIVSSIYFSFIYYLISGITNFNNKKILDFGGGQGFLKKKLKKKYKCVVKVYDRLKELTDIINWRNFNFDIIIFCQVLCLIKKKEILKIFKNLKKRKHITIISAYSKQRIINKIFAFLLGHYDPHGYTMTNPREEKKLLLNHFKLKKSYNMYLFEILLLRN